MQSIAADSVLNAIPGLRLASMDPSGPDPYGMHLPHRQDLIAILIHIAQIERNVLYIPIFSIYISYNTV